MSSERQFQIIAEAVVKVGNTLKQDIAELKLQIAELKTSSEIKSIAPPPRLTSQLEVLAMHITRTKNEIAKMRADNNSTRPSLVGANQELDAVVVATEEATNKIMNAADNIESAVQKLRNDTNLPESERTTILNSISSSVVDIFECCSFQDISGQRISKVVKTLDYIETHIETMVNIWGQPTTSAADPPPEGDSALLHGPQLPHNAQSQDEIDRLFP